MRPVREPAERLHRAPHHNRVQAVQQLHRHAAAAVRLDARQLIVLVYLLVPCARTACSVCRASFSSHPPPRAWLSRGPSSLLRRRCMHAWIPAGYGLERFGHHRRLQRVMGRRVERWTGLGERFRSSVGTPQPRCTVQPVGFRTLPERFHRLFSHCSHCSHCWGPRTRTSFLMRHSRHASEPPHTGTRFRQDTDGRGDIHLGCYERR